MNTRLYYIVPDLQHANQLFEHLLLARININNIHVLTREDIDLGNLPGADLGQKTDVLHAALQGLVVGGLCGTAIGTYMYLNPPEGIAISLVVILALALIGAIFGSWVSSLIGLDVFNTQLTRFKDDIDKGRFLFILDIPRSDVARVNELIEAKDPAALSRGVEPTTPAFP